MYDFLSLAQQLSLDTLKVKLPDAEIEALARFVPVADPFILKASLRELKGIVNNGVPPIFMQRLHRVYNRKIADLSRVFPALHAFETSYRTFVCHMMQDIYGTDEWWRDFYKYAQSLNTTSRQSMPNMIGGKEVSSDMADALYEFTSSLVSEKGVKELFEDEKKEKIRISDHHIIQFSTLKHLREIISSDWVVAKNYFVSVNSLTKWNFLEHFESVRTARNNLFHHRQVVANKGLITHLGVLLDLIGVHLPSTYDSVIHQAGRSIALNGPLEQYHLGLRASRRSYTLTYRSDDEKSFERVLAGTCESEVVMNFMYSEKATKLERVNYMAIVLTPPPSTIDAT